MPTRNALIPRLQIRKDLSRLGSPSSLHRPSYREGRHQDSRFIQEQKGWLQISPAHRHRENSFRSSSSTCVLLQSAVGSNKPQSKQSNKRKPTLQGWYCERAVLARRTPADRPTAFSGSAPESKGGRLPEKSRRRTHDRVRVLRPLYPLSAALVNNPAHPAEPAR